MVKYEIQKDAEAPVPRRGRRTKWDLPLEDLEIGDNLIVYMGPVEARDKANAVRSYIAREQKRMGTKFSVILSDEGIVITRRLEDG